jgi:hypothetical protein
MKQVLPDIVRKAQQIDEQLNELFERMKKDEQFDYLADIIHLRGSIFSIEMEAKMFS